MGRHREVRVSSGRTTFAAGVVLGAAIGFSAGHLALWGRHSGDAAPASPYFASSGQTRPLQPLQDPPAFFPLDFERSFSALDESGTAKVSDALHIAREVLPAPAASEAGAKADSPSPIAAADADRGPSPITSDVERLLPPQPTLPHPAPLPLKLPAATPLSEHDAEREEAIRSMVDQQLGDVPASQKDVWFESLKDLSREDAANVLRMWQQFGGPAQGGLLPSIDELLQQANEDNPTPPDDTSPQLTLADEDATQDLVQEALRMRQRNIRCSELPGFKRRIPILIESTGDSQLTRVTGRTDFSPGILDQTGLPLDWAIDGDGFFEVTDGKETFYTRSGRWTLDADRRIVLADTDPPLLLKGEWVIPQDATEIVLSADGRLSVRMPNPNQTVDPTVVGDVPVVTFANPAGLKPKANALFAATSVSGAPRPVPNDAMRGSNLRQGTLELSNVDTDAEYLAIEDLDALLAE
jgi:flagellar basal body rod protein FlgF